MSRKELLSLRNRIRFTAISMVLALSTLLVPALFAHETPSSDLLLPYFEVDLTGAGKTTIFSVVNSSAEPIKVRMTVYTNWGVEVFKTRTTIQGDAVRTIDMKKWLIDGKLFGRVMGAQELAHCQAAISGQRSPNDDLYYASEVAFNLAVGFVKIEVEGKPRRSVLFGDYFVMDPSQDLSQGDVLVDIAPEGDRACSDICKRHGLRFLDTNGFQEGTEILIWTDRDNEPSDSPFFPQAKMTLADLLAYRQNGQELDHRELDFLPLQILKVSELDLPARSGWFDLLTSEETFIAVRHASTNRFSVGLMTTCLPFVETPGGGGGGNDFPNPRIKIEKSTNGHDADQAPGPQLDAGAAVHWAYVVTNNGNRDLSDVTVTDDQGVAVSCPRDHLRVGQTMACSGEGVAILGQYANIGTVTAIDSEGTEVRDEDPSHYFGVDEPEFFDNPAIDIEKATNGDDADNAPGPTLTEGDTVNWTYDVTNTGNVALSNVTVTDDQGVAVSCPKDALEPSELMTCTGQGTATLGQYRNEGTVTGTAPDETEVNDMDPSHYFGIEEPELEDPSIRIEKATNGHDADAAPGPTLTEGAAVTWTYVVTNTGNVALSNVTVTDDQGVAVSCPQSTLAIGASMTCTGNGFAILGQYRNVGSVEGTSPEGQRVSDDDPSHYYAEPIPENPAIRIEKATNGHDADVAPGPTLMEGDAVTWTYVVTNTGDVALSNVIVTDDQGVAVSCPQSSLAAGASMTCTGHGNAIVGQYRNLGSVEGTSPQGQRVSDDDPSHYYGEQEETGTQGCTPGYWKNHTDSWTVTGYSPSQSVESVFGSAADYTGIGSASLLEALNFGGGGGEEGAARNLLRAAVAGLLNSTNDGVSYPWAAFDILGQTDSALSTHDRNTMLSLATTIDNNNNLGCPLN